MMNVLYPPEPACPGDDAVLLGWQTSEIPLLLPAWQVAALEDEALRRGQTVAQLLRHLVRNFLGRVG